MMQKLSKLFSGSKNFPQQYLLGNLKLYTSIGPLNGIRICDLTRVLAGPYCTMVLGDMGADVIKIEKPGVGDDTRSWGPPFCDDQSYYFISVNRNKRSMAIDITKREGKQIIHKLIQKCDVLMENFLPGKLDSLGIGYKEVSELNPELIYCSLSGYGNRGPDKLNPGYDVTVNAMAGGLSITGEEGGKASRIGVATTDILTGMYAQSAILSALYERTKTGQGKKIDVSLLQSQIALLHSVATSYLNKNIVPQRLGTAHSHIVPCQAFNAKDRQFVVAATNNEQFKNLALGIGRKDLIENKRFSNNSRRIQNRLELAEVLKDTFKKKPAQYWLDTLKKLRIPCGMVNDIKEAFESDVLKQNVLHLHHDSYGTVKTPGPAVEFDGERVFENVRSPPKLGEHTTEILQQLLNFTTDDIDELIRAKIIQT